MDTEFCVVFVTANKAEEADLLAATLVEERLAACVSQVPRVTSTYRWEGKLCREDEILLVIKTRRELFEKLRARVKQLHSYSVPEIIALPIIAGHGPYLDWLKAETGA